MDNLIKLKEEHLPFVELKKRAFISFFQKFEIFDSERAHITANVKLAIQSARIL